MVLAYHVIFTAYGFWLPNDPRGSWSSWIRVWELLRYGEATKTDTRRSVASHPHDHAMRDEAKDALKYSPVTFDGIQARAIALGFADASRKSSYAVHACAILPDHVHMVIGRHGNHLAEQMVSHLKGRATHALIERGLHPLASHRRSDGSLPSPWARNMWKVFLNDVEAIERAITYVDGNPTKEGLARQQWKFLSPHTG